MNQKHLFSPIILLLAIFTSYPTAVENNTGLQWLDNEFKKLPRESDFAEPRFVRINHSIIKFIELTSVQPEHDETPWLFIHGLGGSINDFANLLPLVTQNHHTIALDLPGFGSSISFENTYSIEKYVDTIQEFMLLRQDFKFHLVCHSMGGQICLALSLKRPDLVASLTLIDPAGTYERNQFLENISNQLGKVNIGKLSVNKGNTFNSLSWYDQNIIKRIISPNPLLLMAVDSYKTNFHTQAKDLLLPPLIIWGLNDPIFAVENAFHLKENIKNSTLYIVEDAGHNPQQTHPKLVFQWIEKYHNIMLKSVNQNKEKK